MNAIKKILFGTALILFGFFCVYVSIQTNWAIVQIFSLLFPIVGLGFAICGFLEKEE